MTTTSDVLPWSRRAAAVAAAPTGMLLSGVLVWQTSTAAFTASTSPTQNRWTTGTVALTNDRPSGGAALVVSNIKPGPGGRGQQCVTVTYNGSLAASVKLYVKAADRAGNALDPYLNLRIETLPGGTACSDTGLTPTIIYGPANISTPQTAGVDGTLDHLEVNRTGYATGAGTWAPTGSAQSLVYRFVYEVQDTTASSTNGQGVSAETTFTWEAQNT